MTFVYCATMTKPFHVVAVKGERPQFSVGHFDTEEVAEDDAADRNRRARELKVSSIYMVEPISHGTPGAKERM